MRTSPGAASTGSEKKSRTASGDVGTVDWGDGSVRRSSACADAGAAAPSSTTNARAHATAKRRSVTGRIDRSIGGGGSGQSCVEAGTGVEPDGAVVPDPVSGW